MNLPQVKVIMADAAEGYQDEAPFDRGIFTAGATDLPYVFYDQIRDGGKLLLVLKVQTDYDLLLVLRKKNGHFEEEDRLGCRFVPVTGKEQTSVKSELHPLARSKRIHIYPRGEAPTAQMNEKVISAGRNDYWASF